ncbi:hypothetical protein H103_06776 [Trichophyton rubrum CBS 288.86]|uniref:Uncharacterized protein n=1 Tax=Trichophyton rubrum CBS 288.86 TaxID=1215330 RepID=A0A022VUG6_TRIRU|nr:hypothetical protein H103_06776 [Trichophyton rubrum CBS 288.86]
MIAAAAAAADDDDDEEVEVEVEVVEVVSIPKMDLKTSPSTSPHDHPSSPQTMFRPPINRAMRVLDRSFFKKTIPLAAATVFEARNLGRIKNELAKSNDILNAPRLPAIRYVQNPATEEEKSKKCILLKEQIQANDAATWPPTVQKLVEAKSVELKPYDLHLDYDYWLYRMCNREMQLSKCKY